MKTKNYKRISEWSVHLTTAMLIFSYFLIPYISLAQTNRNPVNAQTPPTTTAVTKPVAGEAVVPYNGVESSIKRFLCTPGISNPSGTQPTLTEQQAASGLTSVTNSADNPDSGDLVVCVNKLYRFGAAIGSFAAVFFIVLAGYIYMIGGENGKTKAKGYITSVIAGLIVIFTSYILLRQINPALTEFRTIQPPQLSGVIPLPDCSDPRLNLGDGCLVKGSSGAAGTGVSNGAGGSIGGNVTGKGGSSV